jgi:glycosyltransferase involved in cell wall biosynthesis
MASIDQNTTPVSNPLTSTAVDSFDEANKSSADYYPSTEAIHYSLFVKTHAQIELKIINQFFPPDYAATGQLIEELAHNLKAYGRISVFTSQPSYAFVDSDLPPAQSDPDQHDSPGANSRQSLTIHRSQAARFLQDRIRGKAVIGAIFFVRTALYLIQHVHQRELVLLTTAPPFLPILGYLLSRICKIRYICLLYDLYPDIAIELDVIKKQKWVAQLWNYFNRLTWKQAEAIIVLSETMKDRILAQQPAIYDKITVIPNWVDSEQIVPIPKQDNWFAQEHGLVEPFTVLYSGNMGRCHDMDTLFEAIRLLDHIPIRFVFIGGGDKRQRYQQRTIAQGLTNCLFLPYQPRANLPFSLTACDVSIVSISEGMEGLVAPSKLYPALASGRPIVGICAENSYLNDIFDRANCGITVRNGDSQKLAAYLEHLSQNPQLAEQLGRSGREYCCQNYTSTKIAQTYLELFQSLDARFN